MLIHMALCIYSFTDLTDFDAHALSLCNMEDIPDAIET